MEQNSEKIITAAENLRTAAGTEVADDFNAAGYVAQEGEATSVSGLVKSFYGKIHAYFKAEAVEGSSALWAGPRCKEFLTNADAKMATFNSAIKNFNALADNLESQGNAWNSFENGAGGEQ